MINAAKPDIVWVGLGSPKQDVWISEHREKIRGSILIASGATFDFFSGRIQQAPEWIRNAGFEWLYRLSKDFRRLWGQVHRLQLRVCDHVHPPTDAAAQI